VQHPGPGVLLQHPVAVVAALAKAVAAQCIVCKVAKKSDNPLAVCVLFGISAVFSNFRLQPS